MTPTLKQQMFGNLGMGIIIFLIAIIGWFGREMITDMKNDLQVHSDKQEVVIKEINTKLADLTIKVAVINTHVESLIDRGD